MCVCVCACVCVFSVKFEGNMKIKSSSTACIGKTTGNKKSNAIDTLTVFLLCLSFLLLGVVLGFQIQMPHCV